MLQVMNERAQIWKLTKKILLIFHVEHRSLLSSSSSHELVIITSWINAFTLIKVI